MKIEKGWWKVLILAIILCFAVGKRIPLYNQVGKDIYAYEKALSDLIDGINPYIWTIKSYNQDDPSNHGFAYLPVLMYIFWPFFILHLITSIPFAYLMKIPVLLADIGIGLLLIKHLYQKSFPATVFSLAVWFFNPYFFLKDSYVFTDPVPILFVLLALYFLEKDNVATGAFYALAVGAKTFPVILLPIFLLKVKNKLHFLLAGVIIALAISLPFLNDLKTYLAGALFVHGERYLQGRPFLFYISYNYKIELFQIIPFKVYTYLAIFSGWVLTAMIYLWQKFKPTILLAADFYNKYVLGTLSFLGFYLFTPVLNRTYLVWFLPVFILGAFEFLHKRWKPTYYLVLIFFWGFYYWYLIQWKDGYHIRHP